jgi:hypothetical protein
LISGVTGVLDTKLFKDVALLIMSVSEGMVGNPGCSGGISPLDLAVSHLMCQSCCRRSRSALYESYNMSLAIFSSSRRISKGVMFDIVFSCVV